MIDALVPPPTPINLAKRCTPVSQHCPSTREVRREGEKFKVILGYRATWLFVGYRTVPCEGIRPKQDFCHHTCWR